MTSVLKLLKSNRGFQERYGMIEQNSNDIWQVLQQIVNSNQPVNPVRLRQLFGQFNNTMVQDVFEFLIQLVDACIPLKKLCTFSHDHVWP